ncbi:MAG TPA: hypothetical protein VJP79_01550 [Nitrososphaera sp.]|nr:hypothetical protein [Nitrososphaera sp.]
MGISQKRLFAYAGIGLVASGIATIFLIYQGTLASNSPVSQGALNERNFQLEEVHANPNLVMHDHVLLQLRNVEGRGIQLPAEIGIAPELWHDHSLDNFGPSRGLLSPIHTHDQSGTIHIESVVKREYTLGEFLAIWGVDQSKISKVTLDNGTQIADIQDHVLARNERLVMQLQD